MKRNCAIVIMLLFCQLFLLGNDNDKVQLTAPHVSSKYLDCDSAKTAPNCTHFTSKYKAQNKERTDKNASHLQYPDTCFLDKYTPCPTAVEVLDKRTRDSKQYVNKDSVSKFYVVKSSEAIHYLKNGQWLTIDERLEPQKNKRFEADRQEEPVGFDVQRQLAYIKTIRGTVFFNNWMLFGKTNGHRQLLAMPDWSDNTVGDDGLRVTNLFPGIDAEMKVGRGSIKTSFIIHKNNYAGAEQLIFADKFQQDTTNGAFDVGNNISTIDECNYRVNNADALHISPATVYEVRDVKNTTINLPYSLSADTLFLSVAVSYLNSRLVNGSVVIDPLVTATNTLALAAITGSMDCGSFSNSCNYVLQVPSPAAATITGISFKFGFQTVGIATVKDGTWGIKSGNCEVYYGADPNSSRYNGPGSVSTLDAYSDITSDLIGCMPTATCTSQNIPFTLKFFNDICSGTSTCTNNYIKAEEPFIILLEGHTVELSSISSAVTICNGDSVTLSALVKYGILPYIYSWSDGGNISSITVAPSTSTTYLLAITDQCGNAASGNVVVTVKNSSASTTMETACNSYTWNETTYTSSGTYTVHFTNSVGCDSTATLELMVLSQCPEIVVPPLFSPNADGINDLLEIENLSIYKGSIVEIYDRYGKRVARYSGTSPGWDGYYLGHPEPSCDYWYLITLPESGKRLTGHFSLKR
ncbi:MAG: T9SS type B sorting domain-containing protein [Paludibacteraceae bacterium]|nr:T9SS type B sorting domain-containing protein [Paludibacteraceae bacterium]